MPSSRLVPALAMTGFALSAGPALAAPAPSAPETTSADPEGPDPELGDAVTDSEDATSTSASEAADVPAAPKPPRVDGPYVGGTAWPSVQLARIQSFETPGPFFGGGFSIRGGDVIYPWLTIGFEALGNFSSAPQMASKAGQLLVDFGFLPAPEKLNLSLRAAFGFGGGNVVHADPPATATRDRGGFGGAAFRAAVRYEAFPGADRRRPRRAGGLALGPELGWVANPPARAGNPMANTVYVALTVTWYGGR